MNSARGIGSQGVLTCRDTSSLFNISGDSNTNNGGNGNGGNSQRSGSRSRGGNSHNHRNSVLSNVPTGGGVIGSNTGVRASMSKTAREPGEEEEVKDEIQVDVKPQETVSTARRKEAKKYYNKHSTNN
jgi:hypothetical protein